MCKQNPHVMNMTIKPTASKTILQAKLSTKYDAEKTASKKKIVPIKPITHSSVSRCLTLFSLSSFRAIKFSSATFLYSCSSNFFPIRSSFAEMPKTSQRGKSSEVSGKPFPHSHFETVFSLMKSFFASFSCVNPFSFLQF